MKYKQLVIEEKEMELLENIMSLPHHNNDQAYNLSARRLKKELMSAKIVTINLIPEDVIRMNSTVTIQMPGAIKKSFKIVVPEKSNLAQNKLSVLSPMGLALIGYAANDEITWQFPTGETMIKILDVSQNYTYSNG